MARLTREEKLGKLLVRLSSGKSMPLSALRGSARVVIAAGTRAQVRQGAVRRAQVLGVLGGVGEGIYLRRRDGAARGGILKERTVPVGMRRERRWYAGKPGPTPYRCGVLL